MGLGGTLGRKGSYRVDAIYRDYDNLFTDQVLPGVSVPDPTGRRFDLAVVVNTNLLDRKYKALQSQIQYRVSDQVSLGGNYTLSNSYGNFNAENSASGPVQDDFLSYTEYKREELEHTDRRPHHRSASQAADLGQPREELREGRAIESWAFWNV